MTTLKVKFEHNNTPFDFPITDIENIPFEIQQLNYLNKLDYENLETRQMHHLYNADTGMFILSSNDIKNCKTIINKIILIEYI